MLNSPRFSFSKQRFSTRRALTMALLASILAVSAGPRAFADRRDTAAGVGFAAGTKRPCPFNGGDPRQRAEMQGKLGLSQSQMDQMQTIREQARTQAETLKERIRQKRAEQSRLMSAEGYDESRAMALNGEITQMRAQLGELRIQTMGRIKGMMTPQQFAQFSEMRAQSAHERSRYGQQGPEATKGPRRNNR
ncbi:MAG: periplasmic heavy metal sensor [Vampirovibrionales bacterium]|nr:periplasmic heavy metal sensor [Vampirovibrionales bacterium]